MSDQPALIIPKSVALTDAARTAVQLGKAAKAANTRKAYDSDWRSFRAWCADHQLTPLPAAPETIGVYIAALGSGAGAGAQHDRACSGRHRP